MRHMLMLTTSILVAFAATPAMADLMAPLQPITGTRLDVSAQGEVTRIPDIATISAGVVTQAGNAASAMSQNVQRMAATISALKKAGIADRDIQTSALSLNPQYRYADNQPPVISGYQASNQVTIRFHDMKRAGPILDALVGQGANQISGPSFGLENADLALDEARTAAIAKAQARADLYARSTGLRVKKILSISESSESSGAPIRPMMLMARAEKADTAIEAGDQKYSVSVQVSFELE